MELKVEIEFNQLIQAIRQLPKDKITQLKAELSSPSLLNPKKSTTKFQELLLSGPVMDDDQYKVYKQTRNHFDKWRTK